MRMYDAICTPDADAVRTVRGRIRKDLWNYV